MPSQHEPTGNPVFDYKAKFRTLAQSLQRVLFSSGVMLILVGIVGRFVTFQNKAMNLTLKWSPVLGIGLILLSGVWGYVWRSKLRRDFRKEFSG